MNKLGFYIQNTQGTHDHISNIQPPVILIHAWDQGLLEDIRRFRAPDTFVVGRMDYIGQGSEKRSIDQTLINTWLDGPDPAARGRELAEHILADNFQLAQRKGDNGRLLVDAWMSLNECIPGPTSGQYNKGPAEKAQIEARLRAYDKFQAAFRARLMEQDIEAVAFNFGAGNFGTAAHYLDFFPETLASYTYLGFHEYGWPAMRPDRAAGVLSSAGSYRPIVNGIHQQTGRAYQAIITEAGLARMFKHSTDGAGDVGWLYPDDPISQEEYWRSLDWYNDYLVQDDFALGACLFQVGVGAGWQTFRHFGPDTQSKPIQILSWIGQLRDKTDHQPQPTVGEEGAPPVEKPPVDTPPIDTPPADSGFKLFLPVIGASGIPIVRVPVAEKVGLDANRPIDPSTGAIAAQVGDPQIIAETGVGWVRLNFVLGQTWFRVAETGWQERYRRIIAGFRSRKLKIYGLIGAEAMSTPPGDQFRSAPPEGVAQDPWIDNYVDSFIAIVRAFHQDVAAFESFNEPDDFHGGGNNWIHPGWFSIMLQAIHDRVRNDPAIRHVTLVSGPVQGLHSDAQNHNNNGGARYLRATYQEGKRRFGWGSTAPFPFDGVGYHPYVAQSPASTEAQVRAAYTAYLNDFQVVIREEEGQIKPIYLSEFGWFSNHGNEDFQERAMRAGMQAALDDPSLALIIWFCTQDFGGDHELKHFGLYRQGPVTPENRKPGVYRSFREILSKPGDVPVFRPRRADTGDPRPPAAQAPIPRIYTNQQAIDAAFNAARRLELADPWELLTKAGQDLAVLAQDRPARYTGPALDEIATLTAREKTALRNELLDQLVKTMRWEGVVTATAGLSLRVGPSAAHDRLRFLAHEEKVQVLDDATDWLFVQASDAPGYVSAEFVMRQIAPTPTPPAPSGNVAGLLRTWLRHKDLLSAEAARLGFDPAVAVAVLLAESSGDGFNPDGRLKIRFENHIFLQEWGEHNRPVFDRFFSFNPQEPWKDHHWRSTPEGEWQRCHQTQAQEWQVLDFARNFVEDPALKSISMGASQIMGFNHAALDYATPRAMFDDFQSSEEAQVRGLFRFIENRRLVEPLRQGDYLAFARGYNGPGQMHYYADLIRGYIELFRREVSGAREVVPGTRGVTPVSTKPGLEKWAESGMRSRILFGMGVISFVMAVLLALITRSTPLTAVGLALVFGGLSAAFFILYSFAVPRTKDRG